MRRPAAKSALDLESPHLGEAWAAAFCSASSRRDRPGKPARRRASASRRWTGAASNGRRLRFDLTPGAPVQLQAQGPGDSQVKISAAPERQNWRGKAAFKAESFPAFVAAFPDASPLAGLKVEQRRSQWRFRLVAGRGGPDRRRPGARPGAALGRSAVQAAKPDAAPNWSRISPRRRSISTRRPNLASPGIDLDLSLEAQTVKLARNGRALGDGGRIKAHFIRDGDAAVLEKLDLRNIGGADLTASGGWTGDFAGLEGRGAAQGGGFLRTGAASRATFARRRDPRAGGARQGAFAGRSELSGQRRRQEF